MPPIHRKNLYGLQYSMLPARRVGIQELYTKLTGKIIGPQRDVAGKESELSPGISVDALHDGDEEKTVPNGLHLRVRCEK